MSWFPGDGSDAGALAAAIKSCEVVFYMLGTTMYSAQHDMAQDLHENVIMALNCFNVSRKLGVENRIHLVRGEHLWCSGADPNS